MRRFLSLAISLFLLAGCANITSLLSTPEPATLPASTLTATATSTPSPTPTVTPGGPRVLRIWVPPQFDPAGETPAGTLLQKRLDEFMARRPGLQIEVRVKAESGPASLLNSLTATQAAAPSIMPACCIPWTVCPPCPMTLTGTPMLGRCRISRTPHSAFPLRAMHWP